MYQSCTEKRSHQKDGSSHQQRHDKRVSDDRRERFKSIIILWLQKNRQNRDGFVYHQFESQVSVKLLYRDVSNTCMFPR